MTVKRYPLDGELVTPTSLINGGFRANTATLRAGLEAGCTTKVDLVRFVETRRREGQARTNKAGRRNKFSLGAAFPVSWK